MPKMRAKLKVLSVNENHASDKTKTGESLVMGAVGASSYPDDGTDENNTFAKWSPSASLTILIANPDLFGQFEAGQQYYVDFTLADALAVNTLEGISC